MKEKAKWEKHCVKSEIKRWQSIGEILQENMK
jgi:hypothetical protein